MKIYVASSWRNKLQPAIVMALERCGHKVYDFRHPTLYCTACKGAGRQWDNGDMCECMAPGCVKGVTGIGKGFSWSDIDPNWQNWTPEEYVEALKHPIAQTGYQQDITALKQCDACVLVLPSGRSASWEFGYAMGQGKRAAVFMLEKCEPELMYGEAEILTSMGELFDAFGMPGTGLEKDLHKPECAVYRGVHPDGSSRQCTCKRRNAVPLMQKPVEPNCKACANCYLDDMDFVCGHKDAGMWGKKIDVAASPEGHCGPARPKFSQHPSRTPEGDIKP